MSALRVPLSRTTWIRFLDMLKAFGHSRVGGKAKGLFILLIVFLFGINGLNVVNSYVGRDFMTAIEHRQMGGFLTFALLYIGVFTASTVVAVYYRYAEERLGLVWRKWLTERVIVRYLDDRTYFRLHEAGDLPNPDQRISEDIRALTATTLSFVLMILNSSLTAIAFSAVLWSISPLLFLVGVLYAVFGSVMTILLGRPLVQLNYDQLDKEANFRARLVHTRENAESIALLRREGRLRTRLLWRLEELTDNFQRIIEVNRKLGFFTTGYNYMIQIIPALVVAPLFIHGTAEFGVISQSAMAFSQLLGAFSLIVTQFQSISSYTAVIARLSALTNAMEKAERRTEHIVLRNDSGRVTFEGLTLRSPRSGRTLVKDLQLSVPRGTCALILAPSESASAAIFRATAGLWDDGEGEVVRPGHDDILFLPARPYLPPGTLREVLLRTGSEDRHTDEHILSTLHALKLDPALARGGGLDIERNWTDLLSLAEQQLLAFSRVLLAKPGFVFLDHPSRALSECQTDELLHMLRSSGITYLTLGDEDDDPDSYDLVIGIAEDGSWKLGTPDAAGTTDGSAPEVVAGGSGSPR